MSAPKKNILMIVVLVLVVAGVGAGGFFLGQKGKASAGEKTAKDEIVADAGGEGHGEEKKAEAEGGHGGGEGKEEAKGEAAATPSKKALIYKFEDFTVNLFDPRVRTFLKVTVQVEATSPAAVKTIEENDIPLRDATITMLSAKTRDELNTPEGQERLKRELLARYEGKLGPKVVNEIYFTDFNVITQ